MSFTEKKLQYAIKNFLPTIGYRATSLKSTKDTGYGFRARNTRGSKYFSVQIWNETCGTKSTNTARNNAFYNAFGRFMTNYTTTTNCEYALTFPVAYKKFIFKNFDSKFVRTMHLSFFFVNNNGKVEYYNWRNFSNGQKTYRRKAA